MKKELFAVTILILLSGLSAWNLNHVKSLTGEISETLKLSYAMAEADDWEGAAELANSAEQKWSDSGGYTQIFIRHSEIDLTTDAFGDYFSEIYKSDIGGAKGALKKLLGHLENIYEMERITLKSVF
ncbi:MAG: DUF4363 family protein [Clostridiales bacterium]|nr:DUF4363 family protein [Clostridiales bacterium]